MNEQGFTSLNVVPLVDVMLVLLTIVLMTSTFIVTGVIPVDLPGASSAEQTKYTDQKTIVLDHAGNYWLSDTQMSEQELIQKLTSVETSADILVRADRELPLQSFVHLMDILQRMGFISVQLQTQEEL